jgi:hypothetical protein
MPASNYQREKDGLRLQFKGINTVNPPDKMPPYKYPFAQNIRAYLRDRTTGRATMDSSVQNLGAPVHSLRRLNDTTPNGPINGFILVAGASVSLFANGIQVDSGLSGNPISLLPFRPNTSVQPWMYVGDSVKMDKVRSDGTTYKMGVQEPQIAPVVAFVPASDTVSTLGPVTVTYWGDSPHSGPTSNYIWKNTGDLEGSGPVRIDTPPTGVTTGNSLVFDSTPGSPATPVAWTQYTEYVGTVNTNGISVTWQTGSQFNGLVAGNTVVITGVTYTIAASPSPTNTTLALTTSAGIQLDADYQAAAISGTTPVFQPALESEGYADFNFAIEATLYIPVAGTYTLSFVSKDEAIWGIGNNGQGVATWAGPSGGTVLASSGQTKTALNGYPLMPKTITTGGTGQADSGSVAVTFSAAGNYPLEIDYDYWYHSGRTLVVLCNGINIPPIPSSVITESQYRYTYRGSSTGATSNPSPSSPEQPLSVLANNITANFSLDPQVDKIDFYRLDTGLENFTYVGTIANAPLTSNLLQPVTATGIPFQVQIGAPPGTSVYPGELALIDLGGSQETVTVLGVAPFPLMFTIVSMSYFRNQLELVVTIVLTSITNIQVGDSVVVSGVSITSTSGTPPSGFTLNQGYTVTSINVATKTLTMQVIYSTHFRNFSYTVNGGAGALADNTQQGVSIIANFTKTHPALAQFVSFAGTFNDTLLDSDVAANPILAFDNFEPFPSIDLPRKGIVNVVNGVVAWVSGDQFNVRWLPGTIIIIGGTAFTLNARPTTTTTLTATNVDNVGGIEEIIVPNNGAGISYEISEPILAAQPLPYLFGPTDNVSFFFGVGDPLRPGTLYWSKGNNPDSAPDTNQQDVTSPSEPLQNGCIVNGYGWVASTERAWLIVPNFFNALSTASGTAGSTWTLQLSSLTRGLYIPRCLCVDGGGNVFFRAKDGIYISPGGQGGRSITDGDLYNLFPHEGRAPENYTIGPYTIYPPDDTQPQMQKMNIADGYLYYDFVDTFGNNSTLVYDIAAGGWVIDIYQFPAFVHVLEEGPNVNGVLIGCMDGSIRPLDDNGVENATSVLLMPSINAGDTREEKHWADVWIEGEIG